MKIRWFIYRFLQKYLQKNSNMSNKTYNFRKYVYFKILKLDGKICHFCLERNKKMVLDYYCWECAEETN